MLVAVLSDSHLGEASPWWESIFSRHIAQADAVLHCGDITAPAVLASLLRHKAAFAVAGNCDWSLAGELPAVRHVQLCGMTVGLCHGWGSRSTVPVRVAEAFRGTCDLACFGHTHQRYFSSEHGLWLLNPGSLAEGSMAHLSLDPGRPPQAVFIDVDQA